MKKLMVLALTMTATAFVYQPAKAAGPQLVAMDYKVAYVPQGFDQNDQVQFVAEGVFPDSCYKPAPPEIDVDPRAQAIYVKPRALRYEGPCMEVIVPFHQVVDVGLIPEGNYTIYSGSSRKALGRLPVRATAATSPDDFLYAPISQIYYRKNTARHIVILNGEFANSCQKFREVRVHIEKNVIVVQPITEITDGPGCRVGRFPFEKVAELPPLKTGRYLMHVRSLNATAVNSLVNIP